MSICGSIRLSLDKTQLLSEAFSWEMPCSLFNRLPWLKLSNNVNYPALKSEA